MSGNVGRINLIVLALILTLAACSTGPQAPDDIWQQTLRTQGRDLGGEVKAIHQAYTTIIENYVKPIEPEKVFENGLSGLQTFAGKERVSVAREGRSFLISSSGQTLKVDKIINGLQGANELVAAFSFVALTNPQCNPLDLAYAAIKSMVSLDRRSKHILPAEYKEMQVSALGKVAAMGVTIVNDEGSIKIVECFDDSPAFKAGILPGDVLSMIDGRPIKDQTLLDIVKQLRGERRTEVILTVEREGPAKPLVFRIIRDYITVKNIKTNLLDSRYAYIRISQFQEKTASDFDKAVKQLRESSKDNIEGMILDLRGNPGGLLEEPIEIARRFIDSGLIVSLEGRGSSRNMKFYANKKSVYHYPMVVLVNQGTAMGSEIAAGALQDYKRAVIMGTPTLQDDSIQTIFPLNDGSALKLTTSVWRLPRGILIEDKGIVPDVVVETPRERIKDLEQDPVVQAALSLLRKGLNPDRQLGGPASYTPMTAPIPCALRWEHTPLKTS
jgi:carboxyl-terminal processing protease